jgi:predicted NUDIX family NTP pyrophosphohydrolase
MAAKIRAASDFPRLTTRAGLTLREARQKILKGQALFLERLLEARLAQTDI